MLKYNTLYQSLKKVSAEWHAGTVLWEYSWSYLKFYENGTVIYTSSIGKSDQLNWFSIENTEAVYYKGNFDIEKNQKLEMSIPAVIGTLKLDGIILENKLILRASNSEMKLSESWDEYSIPDIFI